MGHKNLRPHLVCDLDKNTLEFFNLDKDHLKALKLNHKEKAFMDSVIEICMKHNTP